MSEEEKIESSPQDGKSENPEDVNDELEVINRHISDVNEETEINKSEIKEMEIHHPHHVTHKKKWNEYLLEFFMLFLAVTLGFFAENMRENFTDRERETQYMESMIEDLKSDTTQMAAMIKAKQSRNMMIDSLAFFIGSPDYKSHLNDIYFFARSISPPMNFFPNERTIQQLKSSGGLRLIRNIKVSNSIMEYDQKMVMQLSDIGDEENLRLEYRKSVRNLFDGKVLMSMLNNSSRIEKPQNNPPLFKVDKTGINDLIVDMQYVKKADQIQVVRYMELTKQATELIQLIKQEYHLKDD
jgi:hypothetical protein